jgi:ElaB/YqjD/DUF883 family membrane-anchored ribosome-binding protein
MAETIKDNGSAREREELKKRSRELADDTRRHARETANEAGARGMAAVGERIDRAADYIDERRGRETPIAERLHDAAGWMREHDARDMMKGLDSAVRAHPYRSMAIGVAFGYVIGRIFSR